MMKFLFLSLGWFLMSVVINMTNHLQLSLVSWYMPFEAVLQRTTSCRSSGWFSTQTWDCFTLLSDCINYLSSHPPSSVRAAYWSLQDLTYIAFQRRGGEFFSSAAFEQFPSVTSLWLHPHPIIMERPRFRWTPELRQRIPLWLLRVIVWVINAAPPDWPQCKF